MGTITKRIYVEGSKEVLADVRNAMMPFQKDVFIYAHRYVITTDYTATNQLIIEFDGAQEVLYCNFKEELTASNTNLNATAPAAISGRVGKTVTTDATNGSSLAVEMFAVVRV